MDEMGVLEIILNLETVLGFVATGATIEFYLYFSKKDSSNNERRKNYLSKSSEPY